MNYLWTKYLFYKFIDDEKIYLYNFRNGKDFFLSKEEFETKKFKDDNEFHFLVSNEFLVDSNVDELEVLGKSYREMIGAPGSSFFTQMENGILRYKVFYFTKKNE